MSRPRHRNKHPGDVMRRASLLMSAAAVAMLGAAVGLAGWVLMPRQSADEIDKAIEAIGFHRVKPANRLRGPGSIYVVEDNGFHHQVCKAQASDLADVVQTSPSQSQVRERLEKGGFAWDGNLLKTLNAKLGGNRVTSITYNLTNVTLHEIPDDALKAIQEKLMNDPRCEDVVQDYFKQHRRVCSGYAALSASATFRITTHAEVETDLKLVKQHLEEHLGGQIQVVSKDEFAGENLFYGIQLSDIVCPIPDDDRERRRVAQAGQHLDESGQADNLHESGSR
jgi:hypothetical protein